MGKTGRTKKNKIMTKTFCNLCDKEIAEIAGAGKLIYFERVSSLGEKGALEQRINRSEVDICPKCNEAILKIVQKNKK